MRDQAVVYRARYRQDEIVSLEKTSGEFLAKSAGETFTAKTVLLATGVSNRKPDKPDDIHDAALTRGLLRYCPICDGYEIHLARFTGRHSHLILTAIGA